MSRSEEAVRTFIAGFNCAQAVLEALSGGDGLEPGQARKLATAFGAGMARTGQTCGAVTGAYLALGLRHGRDRLDDAAARDRTYALIQEFDRRFRERHGAVQCTPLIGRDLSTPAGYSQAAELGLFRTLCPAYVRSAVEIAEALG